MTNSNSDNSKGELRRESGRAHFTTTLGYMLKEISHPEMSLLADWALDESGCLHTSQLSHLRNAKMRMLGVKSLDALGRINVCAHAYKQGDRAALKELGAAQVSARIEEILERYTPVMDPTGEHPLDAGDFMMLYLGYIRLELFEGEAAKDWAKVAEALPQWVEDLLDERGMRTREAVSLVKGAWTGSDASRDQFCLMVAGAGDMAAADIASSWAVITKALEPLVGEDLKDDDLYAMVVA